MHRCRATTNYPYFNRNRCSGLATALGMNGEAFLIVEIFLPVFNRPVMAA